MLMKFILEPYINLSINKNDKETLDSLIPKISEFGLFKDILNLFPNIEDISLTYVLTNLVFYMYSENQIILNKGDSINGIYIIFSGEISIYNNDEEGEENDKNKEINVEKNEYERRFIKRKNIIKSIYKINLLPNHILKPGDSLGYNFDSSEDKMSQKIVQATKETIIGYINYKKFDKIFHELKLLDSGRVLPFLKKLNLFGNMNNFVGKLKLCTKYKRYKKESYIFHEGDNYKTFYIIKEGMVNISVKIKKTTKSLIQPELLIGNRNIVKLSGNQENKIKGYYTENLDYNIVQFCQGEIIGDIEYYKGYPLYLYSAKCITQVNVLEIDLKKFTYLAKKCGDNLYKFHKKINIKIDFFKKRIKEINSTIKKVNIDSNKKDFYTKIFLKNIIEKNIGENEKYINSLNYPLGKKFSKYKPLKMNNNINNISSNSLSNFNLKQKQKRKSDVFLLSLKKKKNIVNPRYKLLQNSSVKKINNFFITKNNIKYKSNNDLLMKRNTNINTSPKNKFFKIENYETERIKRNINQPLTNKAKDKNKKNSKDKENNEKEIEQREKILFYKKIKHEIIIKNLNKSVDKKLKENFESFSDMANPFTMYSFNYNH